MQIIMLMLTVAAMPLAFMSEHACAVVVVLDEHGNPVRINQSDYDANPEAFTLYDGDDVAVEAPPPANPEPVAPGVIAPPAPSAVAEQVPPATVPAGTLLVAKDGTKYFVTTPDGAKVTDREGVEAKGYKTEVEAWNAVMAAQKATGA